MRLVSFVVALAACAPPQAEQRDLGVPAAEPTAPDGATPPMEPPAGGLSPGTLEVSWRHGAPSCAQSSAPELQVHAYNRTTYVIRQDMCRTAEAPFI